MMCYRDAGFEILAARRYGTCDVFNVRIDELKHLVMIDCVDREETQPGHYHVAAGCGVDWNRSQRGWIGTLFEILVLRAGVQASKGERLVSGTVGEKHGHFLWQEVVEVRDRSVEQYTTKRIEVNWGFRTVVTHDPHDAYTLSPVPGVTVASTNEHHDHFLEAVRPDEAMEFSIGEGSGELVFKYNDKPAVQEYERRCGALSETKPSRES